MTTKLKSFMISNLLIMGAFHLFTNLSAREIDPNGGRGIKIIEISEPVFPEILAKRGYVEGFAYIKINVDINGNLLDWFTLETSHHLFNTAIAEVIGEWRFEAAVRDGAQIDAITGLEVQFSLAKLRKTRSKSNQSNRGDPFYSKLLYHSGESNRDSETELDTRYSNYELSISTRKSNHRSGWKYVVAEELDHYPIPLKKPAPKLSEEVWQSSMGSEVLIKCYINAEGETMMPSLYKVIGEPDPRAIFAAQETLEHWRFEPLKYEGKPATTQIIQRFRFSHIYAEPE